MPDHVYGIDFSGGVDAGRKIWIAGGVVEGDTLRLEICERASILLGSGKQRVPALKALHEYIREQAPCVVGLDFPFGLPRRLVEENQWDEFVRNFEGRFPNEEDFRNDCTELALARTGKKELRRVTDIDTKTPFSPYNLRLYRQTYYGIRDVLAPLVQSGEASVLPMQPAISGRAWILEICPASTLKDVDLYQTYKNAKSAQVREQILRTLHERKNKNLEVPEIVHSQVVRDQEGDALDSVIAAFATFRALGDSIGRNDGGIPSLVEGRVYV